jgi:hypothetical protein
LFYRIAVALEISLKFPNEQCHVDPLPLPSNSNPIAKALVDRSFIAGTCVYQSKFVIGAVFQENSILVQRLHISWITRNRPADTIVNHFSR